MDGRIEPRPWRRALGWLLFLGPFFFASYGFATWVTGLRDDVGSIAFAWESRIPFVPWTILPYWLIDLLYGVSLLLCRTRRELDTHALRLLAAQLIAVSCFLLFPLRFSFERPPVEGAFGWLFDVLESFDQPFNQLPSLHVALLVLLWVVYLRALPKALHWPLHALFALIGVSVLTTWQHHFIDVPTGLWLGFFCLWLLPDGARPPLAEARLSREPTRRRLAGAYALGTVALGIAALGVGGAALWLLWPAASLALVALAYLAIGPAAFQKGPDGPARPAGRARPDSRGAEATRRRRRRRSQRRAPLPVGRASLCQRCHARPRAAVGGPARPRRGGDRVGAHGRPRARLLRVGRLAQRRGDRRLAAAGG